MSDRVVFAVPALSREVAETAATLEMLERPTVIRLGEAVGADELRRALKGSPLESVPMEPLDAARLRAECDTWTATAREGPVREAIDHVFPVKGVGTVALGVVKQGTLTAHEKLRLFPTDTVVEVRSIQVHDVDVREAACGERVGVALKGIEPEQVDRGALLAPEGSLTTTTTVAGALSRSRYYRGSLAVGTQLQLLAGLQLVPAHVVSVTSDRAELRPDRPITILPEEPVILADLSPPSGPRIVGRVRVG